MRVNQSRVSQALKFLMPMATFVVSAAAMAGVVPKKALANLHAGQTEAEVIRRIGKPIERPCWLDGSHSLVYPVSRDGNTTSRLYVDVGANGRVLDIQYGDDGESN